MGEGEKMVTQTVGITPIYMHTLGLFFYLAVVLSHVKSKIEKPK